jgi:hypothetical protein
MFIMMLPTLNSVFCTLKDLHKQLYDGNLDAKEIERAKEGQVIKILFIVMLLW